MQRNLISNHNQQGEPGSPGRAKKDCGGDPGKGLEKAAASNSYNTTLESKTLQDCSACSVTYSVGFGGLFLPSVPPGAYL